MIEWVEWARPVWYWFLVGVVVWIMCGGLNLVTLNAYHVEFRRWGHELERKHYVHAVLWGPLFTARMLYWLAHLCRHIRCLRVPRRR